MSAPSGQANPNLYAIPVNVKIAPFNLSKPFIYYVQEDLQYNLDAFLLSTRLTLDCQNCRPIKDVDNFTKWQSFTSLRTKPTCCQFTFVLQMEDGEKFIDLRKVVNPVEYLTENANLNFVKVVSLAIKKEQQAK